MDRIIQKKRSFKVTYILLCSALMLVLSGYWVLSDSSSSRIKKDNIQIKEVRKGPFSVSVVGNGLVLPRNVEHVSSEVEGQVVSVNVESGDLVEKGKTLFVIRNEELLVEHGIQENSLTEARAALIAKTFELEAQEFQLQMALMRARSSYNIQLEQYRAMKILIEGDNPPISRLSYEEARMRVNELESIYSLERTRLKAFGSYSQSQIDQYQLRVDMAERLRDRMRDRIEDLNIKATINGIIQDVELEVGQRVELGSVIGLISNPDELFVRLEVSAVQGHRLARGQDAIITVRGEEQAGRVVRIAPNVRGTTIAVDVEIDGDVRLRNNMFVSGRIVVEDLPEALFVEAPSNTVENGISSFYKVVGDGSHLQLEKVETGLLSAGKVQVRSGLNERDKIVVSDTARFNGAERIALY